MKKLLMILFVACLALSACTDNQRAKGFGGTMTVKIPSNRQFVNATWKQDSLWYITTDRQPNHKSQTYTMQEDSSFGVLEGKVVFVEE